MEPPGWGWLGSPGIGIILAIVFQAIPRLLPDGRSLRADCRQFMEEARRRRAELLQGVVRGAEGAALNSDPLLLKTACERYVVEGDSLFQRSLTATRCGRTFQALDISTIVLLVGCLTAIPIGWLLPSARMVVMIFGFLAIILLIWVFLWKSRISGRINALLDDLVRDTSAA